MVMRIRKTNAILGTALIIGILTMIYLVIDTISYEDLDAQKEELNGLEIKLRGLENDLLVNQKTIDQIKETVFEFERYISIFQHSPSHIQSLMPN